MFCYARLLVVARSIIELAIYEREKQIMCMSYLKTLEKASKSIARPYLAISYGRLHADTYPLAGGHLTLSREEDQCSSSADV